MRLSRLVLAASVLSNLISSARPVTSDTIPAIAEKALRSVVLIRTSDSAGRALKQGSGFFVSRDGQLVTNYHVIEGAFEGVVKRSDGAFFTIEGVLAEDRARDLVLLKVAGSGFEAVTLGDSEHIRVGEEVVAVGSPLSLEGTVSNGIVSSIRTESPELSLLQTTAPVSPGSSGGALLNAKGEVIGVTSLQIAKGQNLNFAIPSQYVKRLIASSRKVTPLTVAGSATETPKLASSTWLHVQDGSHWIIRIDGEYLYEQAVVPPNVAKDGGFILCEAKREGSEWVGMCRGRMPFKCGRAVTWCSLESEERILSVTPTRIEGESVTFDEKDFDCRSCTPREWKRKKFSLIPEQ